MTDPVHSKPCAVCPVLLRCVEDDGYARTCSCGVQHRPDEREERRVQSFVWELRAWRAARLLAEHTGGTSFAPVGAARSNVMPALAAAELGVVGNGCKGSRGVWMGEPDEPEQLFGVPAANEATRTRYTALSKEHRTTADAVMLDAHGDVTAAVVLGKRTVELTLAQRVGWAIGTEAQCTRWADKVTAKDSTPALREMAETGRRALKEAAAAWVATEARTT